MTDLDLMTSMNSTQFEALAKFFDDVAANGGRAHDFMLSISREDRMISLRDVTAGASVSFGVPVAEIFVSGLRHILAVKRLDKSTETAHRTVLNSIETAIGMLGTNH